MKFDRIFRGVSLRYYHKHSLSPQSLIKMLTVYDTYEANKLASHKSRSRNNLEYWAISSEYSVNKTKLNASLISEFLYFQGLHNWRLCRLHDKCEPWALKSFQKPLEVSGWPHTYTKNRLGTVQVTQSNSCRCSEWGTITKNQVN